MRHRDIFTKMRTTLKDFFLKNRKKHLINEINNLLRNKFIDEIDVSASMFFFQRVDVLLSTLIVTRQIMLTLKEINIKLNNIERNIAKIIIILIFYVIAAKMNTQRDIDATTTTIIMLYNNINQQKELKKDKKEKTLIFIIKKQSEKNNLRMLFVKKLIKCLQRIEKIKENVMMTKRFFNENVKLIIRSKKVKNRLIINNSLMKNVASSTYAMSRIFEILIHEVRVIDVQTSNQQKIIRRIKKQNEILHSNLRIARIIWLKNVINEKKEISSLIVKIHNVEQINHLIKDDLLHEYSQIFCELFVNNCRIKQCFNCQRYDHIDKICQHERQCSICVESHNDFTCRISIDKKKCVNYENNHSIWSFKYKIKIIEKNKISNIWRTKSILHSIDFKNIQQTTFNEFDVDAQQTFNDEKITSSTSFFCFSIKKILI